MVTVSRDDVVVVGAGAVAVVVTAPTAPAVANADAIATTAKPKDLVRAHLVIEHSLAQRRPQFNRRLNARVLIHFGLTHLALLPERVTENRQAQCPSEKRQACDDMGMKRKGFPRAELVHSCGKDQRVQRNEFREHTQCR